MANIVNFTDKQFENRLNDNLEELVQGKKAVESPTAFLLGGQPGSGKTSLRSAIFEETQGNVIVIDNDTFKQQHPRYPTMHFFVRFSWELKTSTTATHYCSVFGYMYG